jgi:thymidylate synthase (FAD)
MKIIKPSVEFYGAVPTDYDSALKFIEMAGRTCYKSEDKITKDSAEKFVRKLIKHLAMVEHSNFVIRREVNDMPTAATIMIQAGKYLNVVGTNNNIIYVGGNLTAWFNRYIEITNTPSNGYRDESIFNQFLNEYSELFLGTKRWVIGCPWTICPYDEIPKELHRFSAKFICDRGVSHELVRHRPCSFAQESTRYVNYGNKDMEFIEPTGYEDWNGIAKSIFYESCISAEKRYATLLNFGKLKPQQARAVLPNALKTEVITTADLAEWNHIFKLRCAPSAHPDFVRLANPLREKFVSVGLI